MEFSIKQIVFGALLVALAIGLTRYCTPEKIKYETAEMQQDLDSLTTLTRSLRIDKSQLADSLEGTTQAFQDYIAKHKDDLASYNRIIGNLNLKVDSLQKVASLSIWDLGDPGAGTFRDTTLEKRAIFGNGLIEAIARGGIRNDSLFLESPDINQLRPVRIDQAEFINEDNSQVRVVTTSTDFDSLRVESVTTLEPDGRRFPWMEITSVLSFLLGYAL